MKETSQFGLAKDCSKIIAGLTRWYYLTMRDIALLSLTKLCKSHVGLIGFCRRNNLPSTQSSSHGTNTPTADQFINVLSDIRALCVTLGFLRSPQSENKLQPLVEVVAFDGWRVRCIHSTINHKISHYSVKFCLFYYPIVCADHNTSHKFAFMHPTW